MTKFAGFGPGRRAGPRSWVIRDGEVAEPAPPQKLARKTPSADTVMPLRSVSLPKWWPYAPRHAADGSCLFNGRREIEEACARARHAGEEIRYDPKADIGD